MVNFCNLKLYIWYKLIDHIVNNILLEQNLTYVLRASFKILKYVVMLFFFLKKVVALGYNQFCN